MGDAACARQIEEMMRLPACSLKTAEAATNSPSGAKVSFASSRPASGSLRLMVLAREKRIRGAQGEEDPRSTGRRGSAEHSKIEEGESGGGRSGVKKWQMAEQRWNAPRADK